MSLGVVAGRAWCCKLAGCYFFVYFRTQKTCLIRITGGAGARGGACRQQRNQGWAWCGRSRQQEGSGV
jgi:hypothetical protein